MVAKNKQYYLSFDFVKILLAWGVVFGHTYINFFLHWFEQTHGHTMKLTGIESLCVSGFFIVSGIFMAISIENLKGQNPFNGFVQFQEKRIARLFEPMLFATGLFLIVCRFIQHNISIKDFFLYWPTLLFMANINGIQGNNIMWFVSALFWCGIPISALLFYKKRIAVTTVFPLVFFVIFSFIYNKYKCLGLHSQPLIGDFLSSGLLKCIMELIIGIETFYVAKYLKNCFIIKNNTLAKITVMVIELICIFLLLFTVTKGGLNQFDFLIYPCSIFLFCIFLLRKEIVFSFCSKLATPIKFFSRYTFMLYLTHTLLVQPAAQYFDFTKYNWKIVTLLTLIVCQLFAILCFHINKALVSLVLRLWSSVCEQYAEITKSVDHTNI